MTYDHWKTTEPDSGERRDVDYGHFSDLNYELDNIYAEIDRRWATPPEDNAEWHALMDRAAAIRAKLRNL